MELAHVEKKQECHGTVAVRRPKPKVVRDYPDGIGVPALLESAFRKWNCSCIVDNCGAGIRAHEEREKVKEAVRLFHAVRKALQTECALKRPDLEASNVLKRSGRCVNGGERVVGPVPGVVAGDHFYYRIEMCVVGLHRTPMSGIDFIPSKMRKDGKPLATSIVASGGYEDDEDSGDVLKYTGQGGNSLTGDRRQCQDQKLTQGNLALYQSFKLLSPVRVIRGYEESNGNKAQPKIYSYDGLYLVTNFWSESGRSGFEVFRFLLQRVPGQPELGSSVVKFAGKLKKGISFREGLLSPDISKGLEPYPICVVNQVDREPAPSGFIYIPNMSHPCVSTSMIPGCDCVDGCVDPVNCLCARRNGGFFPYNHGGDLMRGQPVLYECGKLCKCPPSCSNRTSQNGLRHTLEVFKTRDRGWGVRSLEIIPIGAFVCEYVGELLNKCEAEERVGRDEYLFDIGAHNVVNNAFGDVSDVMDMRGNSHKHLQPMQVAVGGNFTIDARKFGNVGRFINHGCSGNLFPQNVIFDHDDFRLPHIMLFAMENIPPLTELTYDYNYQIDEVKDSNGMVKRKDCFCGAYNCRGRLY